MIRFDNLLKISGLLRRLCILAICYQIAGCATPLSQTVGLSKNNGKASIAIEYQKSEGTSDPRRNLAFTLRNITELRGKEGYQPTLLGQGRNGMGLAYINYHTQEPVETVVRKLFNSAKNASTNTNSTPSLEVDVEIDNFEYNEFPLAVPAFYSKLSVVIYSPSQNRELSRKTYTFDRDKKDHAQRYMRCWELAKGDKFFHDAFEVIEKRISCQVSSAASEFINEVLIGILDQAPH